MRLRDRRPNTHPCMWGYHDDKRRACKCTPQQIARYHNHVSGPLRDRLDLVVEGGSGADNRVDRRSAGRTIRCRSNESCRRAPASTRAANSVARQRHVGRTRVKRVAPPNAEGRRLLERFVERLHLSGAFFIAPSASRARSRISST
jgi:magnesium chelatase family protein